MSDYPDPPETPPQPAEPAPAGSQPQETASTETRSPEPEASEAGQSESWGEVSAELRELGLNLSAVLRSLAGQQADELRSGLSSLAGELNETLKSLGEAPPVQGVRKAAGQTARDLGAYFSATFKKVNAQIEESLEEERPPEDGGAE